MGDSSIFRNYYGKCDWNIGTLFAHDGYVFRLYDVCERIHIPFPIKYVFGGIPCLFQGGRISPRDADIESAKDIIKEHNKRGIGCRLTFSNYYIKDDDLNDFKSNELLKCINDGVGNGVIVSSDLLAEYIRREYKNLCVISSQVKPSIEKELGSDDSEYYNRLLGLYDIIVVNPSRIDDIGFLESLEDKSRVEFIVNHRCRRNCSMAKEHYRLQVEIEQGTLKGEDVEDIKKALEDVNRACMCLREENPTDSCIFSINDVNRMIDMGFTHFKLEGRDYNGITIIRDIGHWVFNPDSVYLSIAHSIQGGPV